MSNNSHMAFLHVVANEDIRRLEEKERTYKGSWKRRGGVGAFMMLARKWDRLENLLAEREEETFQAWNIFWMIGEQPDGADGTVLAEVRDLRRYLMLVEAEMMARGVVAMPADKAQRIYAPTEEDMKTAKMIIATPHAGKSDEKLRARYEELFRKQGEAKEWGAAVGARDEEMRDIQVELRRRGLNNLTEITHPTGMRNCERCTGTGRINVKHVFGSGWEQGPCPECGGSGFKPVPVHAVGDPEPVPLEDSNRHAERASALRPEVNYYELQQLPMNDRIKYQWNTERNCYALRSEQ